MVARRFNSFEPDRMQSKAFIGVQNIETMQRYSTAWSQLILFLQRIQQSDRETLAVTLLYPDDTLQTLLDDVMASVQAVRQSGGDDLCIEDCMSNGADHAPDLRLHAKALIDAIDALSIRLVKQTYQQDPFSLAVVAYSSLHALDHHGAWRTAAEFRPFLSAIIYCI